MKGLYSMRGIQRMSKKEQKRVEFSKNHPSIRCEACKSGGTLRKLDGKYLCTGCYESAVAGRIKYNI